jgi:hypothetical protein
MSLRTITWSVATSSIAMQAIGLLIVWTMQ